MVGLDDFKVHFQSKQFCDSTHVHEKHTCKSLQDEERQETTGWDNRHLMGGRKNQVIGRCDYVGRSHTQFTTLKALHT